MWIKMSVEEKGPKKKAPKKKKIFAEHKSIIVGGIIAAVAIAGIVSGIIILIQEPKGGICIIGIPGEYGNIDPVLSSNTPLVQVAETLFDFDYTGKQPKLISVLAKGYEWNDPNNPTELTCSLRRGVKFHDGTPFNATAVKWNIDRIHHLVEFWFEYILQLPDGRWIVNETQVIDEYTVRFVLNGPFVPFLHLLTHTISSILSPKSTPANKTINMETEILVGTGPFIYDHYEPHVNITLTPNPHYWGKKPIVDQVVFKFYEDTSEGEDLWNAFLAKEISILHPNYHILYHNSSIQTLKNEPGITVREYSPTQYAFIGMNNKLINLTMRKAISYAINYTYQVENVTPNRVVRARSPIPEGILYSNTVDINVPYYNISLARQILKDAEWPGTSDLTVDDDISSGNEWEMKAESPTPLASYTFDIIYGVPLTEGMALVADNLKQIGIKVIPQYYEPPFQLVTLGWIYDYNDPHNGMIDYYSRTNWVHMNDSLVDQWIEEGLKENNPTLREEIYYKIQKRLIEELYPVILISSRISILSYVSNLKGLPPNPFKMVLKDVYFL